MATIDGKGYVFPDPVDPGDMYCFRVYVPKHQLYLAAFWGAYQFFATWLAWARDPLKRGRLVARVWEASIDKARAEFERTKGECMANITGMRQNPLKACEIQVQYDGGAWVTVADMSCCGGGGSGGGDCVPPLRLGADGAIEVSHDGGATWDNTAPGIDPTSEQNIPPVYTGDPEGRCKAANGYLGYLKNYLENLLQNAGLALAWGDFFLKALEALMFLFGYASGVMVILNNILQEVYSSEGPVNTARLAAKDDMVMICYFLKAFNNDGSTSPEQLARLEADLRAQGAAESDEDIKWWWNHVADLVNIFGVGGAQKGASYVAVNPEDCTTCEWEAVIDFKLSDGGFVPHLVERGGPTDPRRYGTWVSGTGWKTQQNGPRGNAYTNRLVITKQMDTTNIVGVDIEVYVDPQGLPCYGSFPPPDDGYTEWNVHVQTGEGYNEGGISMTDNPYNCLTGAQVLPGTVVDVTTTQIVIETVISNLGWNPGAGSVNATKLTIRGRGLVPNELSPYIQ